MKLQRVAFDVFYQTMKGTDKLFVVESFELLTKDKYIAAEHRPSF